MWPCFPPSSALQKCALNMIHAAYAKGQGGFSGKFLVDVRIMVA